MEYKPRPRRVILETPYAGNAELNLCYLRACMHDSLQKGEAPFASHGLYTQPGVLRDDVPAERDLGIQAGFAWRLAADATVVYMDLGITKGMQYGIVHVGEQIRKWQYSQFGACPVIEYRALGAPWAYSFEEGSGSYEQDAVELEGARSYFSTSRWTGK